MKVAVYTRISTNHLGQDIDRQIHECRRYCKIMGYDSFDGKLLKSVNFDVGKDYGVGT